MSVVTDNDVHAENNERDTKEDDEEENAGNDEETEGVDNKKIKRLSVLWLVRKMAREANHEAIYNNKVSRKVCNNSISNGMLSH